MPRPAVATGCCLLETSLGWLGLVWGGDNLLRLRYPEADPGELLTLLELDHGPLPVEDPPPALVPLVEALEDYLSGGGSTLEHFPLDLSGVTPFRERVYRELRRTRPGETVSYGELAERIGSPGAARAVGSAMSHCPLPLLIPCHRVVGSGAGPQGKSRYQGRDTNAWLLDLELRHPSRSRERPDGLEYDPELACEALARQDPALGRLLSRVGPCTLEATPGRSPFQSLVRSIVYQQITGKAAATILGRVVALFPGDFPTPEELLEVSDEELRGAGLSRPKLAAMRDLARKTLDGVVPSREQARQLSDEELVERLVQVRGIGRWTVQMLLIFGLGRPDVFPPDDLGIRKGYAVLTGRRQLPEKATMERRAKRWRPYRSVASWYLWRATEL